MRLISTCLFLLFTHYFALAQKPAYGLNFSRIPQKWDEGIPLGNGWLGALVWEKNGRLRMSLDRVDLWDDRTMPEIDQLKFSWVKEQVGKKEYKPVQVMGDIPYEKYPAPSKIPGAVIEFNIQQMGEVLNVNLNLEKAVNTITFDSGIKFTTFVHATAHAGFFIFEGIKDQDIIPELIEPAYHIAASAKNTDNSRNSLTRLGYAKGSVIKHAGQIIYHQPTYGDNYYEVLVEWKKKGGKVEGSWTITNGQSAKRVTTMQGLMASHLKWWKDYWNKSSVTLPDTLLERQYKLDMYKFGCVARPDTPPISLQAIWTADNGSLPPWKGDFHYDLNVEMSYWPGYAANHLDLTASLTNWQWKVKEENRKWTKSYFEVDGINVPGVSTISGKPMGGWIQYAMSPTTSTWLAHHFYLQWKYSMDDNFLKEKCYPYMAEVETYLKGMLNQDKRNGKYALDLSSSPEYNDCNLEAWFKDNTNYDLSLIHNFYLDYAEVAKTNKHDSDSEILIQMENKIIGLDFNESGLTIAHGTNLSYSHRHLSHLMAIYPLSLLNKENEQDKKVMLNSINTLNKLGTRDWVGFSFTWLANIYAQTGDGDSAVVNLRKFAQNFCSPNSFHLNGDQKGGQYSNYTYRPFTLEANFGFAEGIHQLLLQSQHGYIEVFPALPVSWKNLSFKDLRAQGAFLISANKENGSVTEVRIFSERGGLCKIKAPFNTFIESGISRDQIIHKENNMLEFQTKIGQVIILKNGYE